MQDRCYAIGCFLNNNSETHAHYLATLLILCNFISLRAFTVYIENSLSVNSTEVKLALKWVSLSPKSCEW